MHFHRVTVTFCDAINIVYDVIRTSLERNDNFLAKARKLSILPTLLDIFDARQDYVLFSTHPMTKVANRGLLNACICTEILTKPAKRS